MKKIYNTPSIQIVNIDIEEIMVCTSCVKDINNGFYFDTHDINGTAGSGDEMDAAGYRSNLWDN